MAELTEMLSKRQAGSYDNNFRAFSYSLLQSVFFWPQTFYTARTLLKEYDYRLTPSQWRVQYIGAHIERLYEQLSM